MSYYDRFAAVHIKDGFIKLTASLNPNANEPIQGEEYLASEGWRLPLNEAITGFKQNGFWPEMLNEEKVNTNFPIYLYDNMDDKGAMDFITTGTKGIISIQQNKDFERLKELQDGFYTLFLPDVDSPTKMTQSQNSKNKHKAGVCNADKIGDKRGLQLTIFNFRYC